MANRILGNQKNLKNVRILSFQKNFTAKIKNSDLKDSEKIPKISAIRVPKVQFRVFDKHKNFEFVFTSL